MRQQIPCAIESSQTPTSCESFALRSGIGSPWLFLFGVISLGCCTGSPMQGMPAPEARPDLSAPLGSPDLSSPEIPDPSATISVPDCAATSLIQAINDANDEIAHPGPDVIALKSGCVYTLTGPDNWWYGPTGLPAITSDVTIRPEAGGRGVVIERELSAPKFRLFYVNGAPTTNVLAGAGTLTLRNMTLRNGLARGGNGALASATFGGGGGGGLGAGGAIFAQGTVVLNGVTLTGNTAQGGAGSTSRGGGLGAGGGMGGDGGIQFNATDGPAGGGGMKDNGGNSNGPDGGSGGGGPLTGAGGGGATASLPGVGGSTVGNEDGQDGTSGSLGGIGGGARRLGGRGGSNSGVITDGGGGGFLGGGCGAGGGAGFGGKGGSGFAASPYFCGGGGAFGGGGGGGNYTGSGHAAGGGGGIGGGGGGNRGGGGFGGGGAGSSIATNGGFGGGAGRSGNSAFGSTTASGGGGGGGAGLGGAIFLMYGDLTIVNSTMSGNTAQGGNPGGVQGAGLGLGGAVFILNGTATVRNSTLSFNVVANGTQGPAIGNNGRAIYLLSFGRNVTATDFPAASLTLANSILADSTPCGRSADMVLVADRQLGTVTVTAELPNVIESHAELNLSTFTGTPITTDPQLGPLMPNGGPTDTQSLAPTSPAGSAGDIDTCRGALAGGLDQRGQPRGAATCHLGAVELITVTAQATGCACTMTSECSSNLCTGGFCE